MGKLKVMMGWFDGKMMLRVPRLVGKGVGSRERIAYAFLLRQARNEHGATLGEISRGTGLCRTTACIKARDRLVAAGLAVVDGDVLRAVEPTEAMAPRAIPDAEFWGDRLAYFRYVSPRNGSEVSVNEAWIYAHLWKVGRGAKYHEGYFYSSLAKMSGMHRTTVSTCVGRLEKLGLIKVYRPAGIREVFAVEFLKPTGQILNYFQDTARPMRTMEFFDSKGERYNPQAAELDFETVEVIDIMTPVDVNTEAPVIDEEDGELRQEARGVFEKEGWTDEQIKKTFSYLDSGRVEWEIWVAEYKKSRKMWMKEPKAKTSAPLHLCRLEKLYGVK